MDRIEEIRTRWKQYDSLMKSRKAAALSTLQSEREGWYLAICSKKDVRINYIFTLFEEMGITFRNVELLPLLEELSDALQEKNQISRIWSYSSSISHELFIEGKQDDFNFTVGFLAYYLIGALRVISGVDFIVPMASNHSWSCVPASPKDSMTVIMLEEYPKARSYDRTIDFTQENFEWVNNNAEHFYCLIQAHPQIRIAVDTLIAYNQHANERMCVAALWAGIEAVLGIGQELSFRLAAYIAAYLEPFGEERLGLYRKIKKMYAFRSKAVHGGEIKKEIIDAHIIETKMILRRLLINIAQGNKLPTTDDFEALLFTT